MKLNDELYGIIIPMIGIIIGQFGYRGENYRLMEVMFFAESYYVL